MPNYDLKQQDQEIKIFREKLSLYCVMSLNIFKLLT